MRIRTFHYEDMPTLLEIEQQAALADGRKTRHNFATWLTAPAQDALSNVFVITDDDDELNTWGQAGTLEGIEGEIVGYTIVQVHQDEEGYHLLCQGTVHPAHRQRNAGRALLICALNRARVLAEEFEFEAEQAGIPVYFEARLPAHDMASPRLAAKCELIPTNEVTSDEMRLYRGEL
jgi:ribosomal protein S18 acetylase RimI-like enzyme